MDATSYHIAGQIYEVDDFVEDIEDLIADLDMVYDQVHDSPAELYELYDHLLLEDSGRRLVERSFVDTLQHIHHFRALALDTRRLFDDITSLLWRHVQRPMY